MENFQIKRKSQAITAILWGFMLHRFYLGKHLTGILQIFTGGGLLIWWFYDLFSIVKGTITDKHGNEID